MVGVGMYTALRRQLEESPPVEEQPSLEDVPPLEQIGPRDDLAEESDLPDEQLDQVLDDDVLQRHVDSFSNIVNAIEIGADSSGDTPINDVIDAYAIEDTLLAFPPGTYGIDPVEIYGRRQFGLVGVGDDPTRIVPTSGNCRGANPYLRFDGIESLTLDSLTFDFRDEGTGGPVHFLLEGESVIRDFTFAGSCLEQISMMRVEVLDEDGSAEFLNLQTQNVDADDSLTGVYVGANHAGDVIFRDCLLLDFSDNALYASAPGEADGADGDVHVIGGEYRNNNIAGVRLGSTAATARDVRVVVDGQTPGNGNLNARGFRLRNRADQVIEDCEIAFAGNAANSFGAIVFHPDNGGGVVRNTGIRMERNNVPAIKAFPVDGPTDTAPQFEWLVVGGNAENGATVDIEGRDETTFRKCRIVQRGSNRSGIELVDCANCRIVDSYIEVDTAPIVLEDSNVSIENTSVVTSAAGAYIDEMTAENEEVDPVVLD